MDDAGDAAGRPGRGRDDLLTGTAGTTPDVALTTAEAAKVAGVSARTVRRWIEKGALPAVTGAGGVLYVFPRDLEAARVAAHARPVADRRADPAASRTGKDVEGNPDVRDGPVASPVPNPAGEAAGAVLVAWRDTVLAPVVEQLAAVTRDLADSRQTVGRLEAERDALARERDDLARRLEAARDTAVASPAPSGATERPKPATGTPAPWWRFWERLR